MILLNLEFLNIHIIVDVDKYLKERERERERERVGMRLVLWNQTLQITSPRRERFNLASSLMWVPKLKRRFLFNQIISKSL